MVSMPAHTPAVLLFARSYLRSATRSSDGDAERSIRLDRPLTLSVYRPAVAVFVVFEPMETLLAIWADAHPGACASYCA